MQSILTHIPIVIIQNIGIMAFLYLMFLFIKQFANTKAAHLFNWALVFYVAGALHFIYTLYYLTTTHASLHQSNQTTNFDLHFGVSLDYLPYLGVAYLIVFAFFVIRMLRGYVQVTQLTTNLTKVNKEPWDALLASNNMSHVTIALSNDITVPMTLGWWEPIILLPMTLSTSLSPIELKSILLHELAHIIRNDYFVQFFIELFHSMLFFNPFSYLFKKELQLAREMACDDWVISQTEQPIEYSKLLYQLATIHVTNVPSVSMKLLDNQNELLTRIKQINKVPHQSIKNWALKSLVALSSIFIVMISLFIPTEKNHHLDNNVVVAQISKKLNPTVITLKSEVTRPHIIPSNESKGQTTVASIQNESKTVPDKQEKEYNEVVSETLRWLQSRASNKQFANYQLDEDSVALQIAERLVISSAITNYQLKKEILNRKLENITDEYEASEILKNSKEWNDIKQYESLAKIYLAKHPEVRIADSLYKKF